MQKMNDTDDDDGDDNDGRSPGGQAEEIPYLFCC